MGRRIALIDGHPDGNPERFCHALANPIRKRQARPATPYKPHACRDGHSVSAQRAGLVGWHTDPAIRAARIVVTMGMPALIYRFFFKRQAWLDALRRLGRRGN